MYYAQYDKHIREYYLGQHFSNINCQNTPVHSQYKCWLVIPGAKSVIPKTVATELQIGTVGVHTNIVPVKLLMTPFIDCRVKIYSETNFEWWGWPVIQTHFLFHRASLGLVLGLKSILLFYLFKGYSCRLIIYTG